MSDPPLIETVRHTVTERGLIRPGERVLVAVSGGPDSLALLHALLSLAEEWSIELGAAHLDHRMRGAVGEADAAFVRATAEAWGIPVEIGARDVPALARRAGISLEEAGRAARYRFFGRAARRTGSTAIATGHTADDRAETVLLHLFRGTGLDGLAGFPAQRPLRPDRPGPRVIRPLLDVTRGQVLAYCAAHGLQPRRDATNDSPDFLRNRLRRELMPVLEADYSPTLRRHLLRLARLAEEETALLDDLAWELLEQAGMRDEGRGMRSSPLRLPHPSSLIPHPSSQRLARAAFLNAAPALARRALRLAIQASQPGPPPELATVERLLALLRGECPGFTLPGGRIVARVTADALILAPMDRVPPFVASEPTPLVIPGVTPLPWTTGAITAEALGVGRWALGVESGRGVPELTPNAQRPTPATALLDRACLTGPLTVRPPRPGDSIQPLGMTGHRKLQDLLADRKVPRDARRRLPVVCDAERIVWVAGHCVSDAAKITEATTEAVRLVWEDGA